MDSVVVTSPYEATASFVPGCRLGPEAVLAAWERLLRDRTEPPGPPANLDAWCRAHEPWVTDPEEMRGALRERVGTVLATGSRPLVVGGEHTVTPAALEAFADPADVTVVQFDAHADLRADYEGTPWNHACALRRTWERGHPIVQLGIRSACREELAEVYGDPVPGASHLHRPSREGAPPAVLWTRHALRSADPDLVAAAVGPRVYLTIDLDALDPACAPGVGTPEPDGLSYRELLRWIDVVLAGRTLVGADVVELCPPRDDGRTAALTVRLLQRLSAG